MSLTIWTCSDELLDVLLYRGPPRAVFEFIGKISIQKMTILIMHLLHEVSAKLEVNVQGYYPLLHLSVKYSLVEYKLTDLCHNFGTVRFICVHWRHSVFQKWSHIWNIILWILQYQCIEVRMSNNRIRDNCLTV